MGRAYQTLPRLSPQWFTIYPRMRSLIETVFSLDGMGLYFYNALLANDPYPVMAWLMVTATMIIVFNLLADIAYGYLDPRVRYE